MVDAERSALTTLCREFDALIGETRLHTAARQQLLERIVAEARARRPVLTLLGQLLNTDRETTLRTLATGLPGAGPGTARQENFRCPDGACDRTAVPPPAGALPRCAVLGRVMERG
ncbi:hypothetical protein M2164_005799 [Streptomyces sp. SAI-208]|nr:hypothetical protein [Streptomyces sp. SAI-090]MDH6551545.1 hypothetical protein [Streptomyces sp. SAI-041]MDH6570625.1 hypothetical protein [Streptomyces sp. SAI-117]MDH6584399.1 hypothetical protein [Streptomyces sp. SAI-133]MDH6610164.1 hypothetical protein [Streptomyces sp. SAI-208]MDH6616587.1 hypothetical protein [Streptomyces sp. SAI-135]